MVNFNNVNDYSFSDEANDEPLSKEEVKSWLRIDGNEDNSVIENLITSARIIIESYLNQSLIKRTVTAVLNNSCGNMYLPFQPFIELESIKDYYENDITDYKLTGNLFKRLEYPCEDNLTLVYTAGVDEVSKVIHTALLMQISFMYENRGDAIEIGRGTLVAIGIAPMAKSILKGQRR